MVTCYQREEIPRNGDSLRESESLMTQFFSNAEYVGRTRLTFLSFFRPNLPSCIHDGIFPRTILDKAEDVKVLQRKGSRSVGGSALSLFLSLSLARS